MAGVVTRIVFVGASKKPNFVTETCPLPTASELQEGEVLLKMRLATICSSDLEALDGKWAKPIPSVMGHEGVGEVLISKRQDMNLSPGDRVVFSANTSCGMCLCCQRGFPSMCPVGIQYGQGALSNASRLSGTFASHLILRRGTHIVRLPSHLPDSIVSPTNCPLVTMVNAIEYIATKMQGCRGKKIAVVQGVNIHGIYGCLLLSEAGFSEIYITDSNIERQRFAARFGAVPSFNRRDRGGQLNLPSSCSVDVVIQANNHSELLPEGVDLLRPGGLYILISSNYHSNSLPINGEQLVKKCLTIHGITGYQKHHLDMAVDFLAKINSSYPLHELISPKFSLHDLPAALRTARSGLYHRVAITMESIRTPC